MVTSKGTAASVASVASVVTTGSVVSEITAIVSGIDAGTVSSFSIAVLEAQPTSMMHAIRMDGIAFLLFILRSSFLMSYVWD